MTVKKKLINEIISQGAPVSSDMEKPLKEWTMIALRMPNKFIKEINKNLNETIGISRTGWILQAIQEKLEKKSTYLLKEDFLKNKF